MKTPFSNFTPIPMDISSASVNLFHSIHRPTPAVRDPTREQDWIVRAPPHDVQLPPEIPSVVPAVVTHDDDARGGISTTEETSREHDVLAGHVDGAPIAIIPDDSLVPPSSRRDTAEDSDSDSDDDLIILVNYEDHELPAGEWCSPYQIWNVSFIFIYLLLLLVLFVL